MNRKVFYVFSLVLISTIIFTGCGRSPTAAPVGTPSQEQVAVSATSDVSSTPDPCLSPQIEEEVQNVHKHMREFDDASILASNMPREQLSDSIADLQRIRREAEDERIPDCLTNLKTYQVDHMNSVINTLVAFVGGTDQQTLEQGISTARQLHDQYTLELARLLGLTVVPATVPVISTPAETPTP